MSTNTLTVGIFIPPAVDQYRPDLGEKMIKLLENMDIIIRYPPDITSSGMELFNIGDRETAKTLGKKMIEAYEECQCVVSCGSADVAYMKKRFPVLFHNTTLHNDYRQFTDKLYDITDFLVNIAEYSPSASFPHRVAYMNHCVTRHDYLSMAHPDQPGLADEAMSLLKKVNGIELVEMAENDVCCGFGELFANQFTPISDSLARRKIDNALAAGAEVVTSTELSCLLHLQSFADRAGIPLRFLHLLDIISV